MSRVLAIDPGQSLGWATDASGRLEWGTEDFSVRRGENSGARWERFNMWLVEATHTRSQRVEDGTFNPYDPVNAIIYERASFHPYSYAAEIAGKFYGDIEQHAERHGIALHPVAPSTLKTFALGKAPKRKKGDPKQDRSKEAMVRAAIGKLNPLGLCAPIIFAKPGEKSLGLMTHDEADALWLYWWGKEALC